MKLENEKREVFKDPFPVNSLSDVGRIVGYGLFGAGNGATAAGIASVGTGMMISAMGVEKPLFTMIVSGIAIGTVTGAAIGIARAINKCGFEKLVDKAKELANSPGFDRSVLDAPIKGLLVGEVFVEQKKESTNHVTPYLANGKLGLEVSASLARIRQARFDDYASDPNHRHGELVGYWDGKSSLLRDNDERSRNCREATMRDVIEFRNQLAGKEILREFIQTGRVDSFLKVPAKVEIDPVVVESTANRLAGFMKSSLKSDSQTMVRNSPRPG